MKTRETTMKNDEKIEKTMKNDKKERANTEKWWNKGQKTM